MKIIVCVKQIAHTYARTGNDPDSNYLAPEDRIFRINPYDESALDLALRTKQTTGAGEITLITLGPMIAEAELRRCLALGADQLYYIDAPDRLDPWSKSVFLTRAVKRLGADMVFCGKESLDSRNGQVGAFMAHHLDMPFVSCIREVALSDDGRSAEVQRGAGRGIREIIHCPLPAVFSVDTGGVHTSLPTYAAKQQSRNLPFQKIMIEQDVVIPKTFCSGVYPPRPRPKKVPAPDSRLDAFDRIEQLLTGSRVEKKGKLLTGDPESQVGGIVSFLEKLGFLEAGKPAK